MTATWTSTVGNMSTGIVPTMTNDELTVRILQELRETLLDVGDWSLIDESVWEEYAREGGAYCPLTWDGGSDYLDASEAATRYTEKLEARLTEHGIVAGADGYAGVYRIERESAE